MLTNQTLLSPSGKLAINVKEAAGLLGVSLPKMYEFVHQEGFPQIKNGNGFLIPYAQFVEWVNSGGVTQ
ncbi:MAG: excisionase family DNA-binding protein [Clostridia bacterium]|nr:excisionase family DNA-binding protein [Clostridia bacterium]